MGLLFLHLVPEAYVFSSIVTVAEVFLLIDFVVQILIDYMSIGLEHGYVHLDGN